MRRIALLLLGSIFLLLVLSGLWSTYGPRRGLRQPHGRRRAAYHPFVLVGPLLVIVLVGGYVAWRVLRRTAAPVADVMEAADRVAAGDYSDTRATPAVPTRCAVWPTRSTR